MGDQYDEMARRVSIEDEQGTLDRGTIRHNIAAALRAAVQAERERADHAERQRDEVEAALGAYAHGSPLGERVAILLTDRDAATRCALERDAQCERVERERDEARAALTSYHHTSPDEPASWSQAVRDAVRVMVEQARQEERERIAAGLTERAGEEEARAARARNDPDAHEARGGAAALREEADRLAAAPRVEAQGEEHARLPVIAMCGRCPFIADTAPDGEGPHWQCLNQDGPEDAIDDPSAPPPSWCPLRGAR